MFVHKDIKDAFLDRLTERLNAVVMGDPQDPDVNFGPMVSENQRKIVQGYIEKGVAEGARLVTGGNTPETDGFFIEPTVFADVTDGMTIAKEEIFGPVMCVLDFETEEEALERANATEFGLAASVFTNDLTRALRFTDQLEAGMIWVNSENVRHLPTPFGGVKASGIGRDGGDWSFEFYMEQKHIGFATGQHKIMRLGA